MKIPPVSVRSIPKFWLFNILFVSYYIVTLVYFFPLVHYNKSMECVKQVDDKPTGGHSYSMVRREVSSDHAGMAAIKVSIIL